MRIIFPEKLNPGDKIAILCPAGIVKEEYILGAKEILTSAGYEPVLMPHALGPISGSYSSDSKSRLADFVTALNNPEIKGIFCGRGGYGAVELIGAIPPSMLRVNNKWLVGFSDISALHAMMHHAGVASIHGAMAKHLSNHDLEDESTQSLLKALGSDEPIIYETATTEFDVYGEASGRLIGGNLAVLHGLAGTDFDLLSPQNLEGNILFIEDISEPIYAVERMLWRLRLSGALSRISGLLVGKFTDYKEDRNFKNMESMISFRLKDWGLEGIPVSFGVPFGHIDRNFSLIEGASARLRVDANGTQLIQRKRVNHL